MDKECIFCKIVKGEIPCEKIWGDENFLAIVDAFPVMENQILIFPKKHIVPYVFDLEDNFYCKLLIFAKKIAKAMDESLKPIKTGMIVEGLEVNHVHVKLFPFFDRKGFGLSLMNLKPSQEQMKGIADKIKQKI